MDKVAQHLIDTLEKALPLLREIPAAAARIKPRPEKWSKQEIIGHLIDSANNNQQKFVRTMLTDKNTIFTGYAQQYWVDVQAYNTADWQELLNLWESINRHLAHIIRNTPAEKLDNSISIDGSEAFSLRFIQSDYVEHLKHHLNQALPEAGFKSSFENIYNT